MATILALDPSFTCTGWVVLSIPREAVIDMGVIRTEKAAASERLLSGEDDALRGGAIFRAIRELMRVHEPAVVAQEVNAGSQHAAAAKALARAQQACHDAVISENGYPIYFTAHHVKKSATGRKGASKAHVEVAMRERWKIDPVAFATHMKAHKIPQSKWENIFDALAVGHTAWNHPAVCTHRGV